MNWRKILRRTAYVVTGLLVAWGIYMQTGVMPFRIPDAEWAQKLKEKGQAIAPKFLDVGDRFGRRVHAVCISFSDSLPLVIMVHGSPGASDAYLDYLSDTLLSARVRMASLDRPGFGYTSGFGVPEPSMEAQAAAVKALADQLAPGRKVYLVGHSMGGPIITRFAMDYPEQTAGLLIVAGSVDPSQEAHPWWQTAVDYPPLKWLIPKSLWTSNAEIIPLEKELTRMLPLWPKIQCPVEIFHALDDQLVPVANVDFTRKMLVNSPKVDADVIPKGDHFILWSRVDQVRAMLLALVEK